MSEEFDDYDDEFDNLRARSARRAAAYDSVDVIESDNVSFLERLTPMQRMILAIVFFIDVIIVAYVVLAIAGFIARPF